MFLEFIFTAHYYGYDYYQIQLEQVLNDDFDENQFAQQMIDAYAKMVYTDRKICQNNYVFVFLMYQLKF